MLYTLGSRVPKLLGENFVADDARVMGSVTLHARANVWFGCVLRGDNDDLIVGENTNVQDWRTKPTPYEGGARGY